MGREGAAMCVRHTYSTEQLQYHTSRRPGRAGPPVAVQTFQLVAWLSKRGGQGHHTDLHCQVIVTTAAVPLAAGSRSGAPVEQATQQASVQQAMQEEKGPMKNTHKRP